MIKPRKRRCRRHIAYTWEMINKYKILYGKPKQKTPVGTPNRR
jgi:hypothetical protein